VQAAADPVPGLEHRAVDAGMRQGVRDRESGDAGADDEHTLDRARESRRDLCPAVVEGPRHDTTGRSQVSDGGV
jgi:hypothetical protein